ncbi:MAG: Flp pilus assembly protein CpaB [Coriobacteriales bacterium]|jgi:pilus assembly protein CpaB
MKVNRKTIVGIACGLLAAVCMFVYASGVRAEALGSREAAIARYGGDVVEVCVASRSMAAGETIADSDIVMREWLVDLLPADAATDSSDIVGQTVVLPLVENEPVSMDKIGKPGSAVPVPDGLCAVTVPSEDVLAVGGALEGGSLVDIYAANASGVRLLGEGILVLETSTSGMSSQGAAMFGNASGRGSVSWVTLAVTPESVEELISASQSDRLHFVLPGSSIADSSPEGTEEAEGDEADA